MLHDYYSASVGERSIVISLSVCLFVFESISGTTGPIFRKFFVQIPMVAICYALLVLWMASRLAVMGRMAMRGRLNF